MRGAEKKVQGNISIIKQSADYQVSVQSNHRSKSFLPNLKLKLNSNRGLKKRENSMH